MEFQEERIPIALRPIGSYEGYHPPKGPQLVEDLQETIDRREEIYPVPLVPIHRQRVRRHRLIVQVRGDVTREFVIDGCRKEVYLETRNPRGYPPERLSVEGPFGFERLRPGERVRQDVADSFEMDG